MSLVSLLVSMTLISLVSLTPMTYAARIQRDTIPVNYDNKPKLVETQPDAGRPTLNKPLSLSITNSIDVLRNRVDLELKRRRVAKDQQQIDENRRIMEKVGKRSLPAHLYEDREHREARFQYHLNAPEEPEQ